MSIVSDLCLNVTKFVSEAIAFKTVITERKRIETGKILMIILCFCDAIAGHVWKR